MVIFLSLNPHQKTLKVFLCIDYTKTKKSENLRAARQRSNCNHWAEQINYKTFCFSANRGSTQWSSCRPRASSQRIYPLIFNKIFISFLRYCGNQAMSSTPSQLSIISHQFQQTGQFYPLPNYIKNYVDHVLDQENLHLKIKNWKDSLEPFHHTQCSQPLLWIHQNEWQNQELLVLV